MHKRTIKWEKFRNPLLTIGSDGEEEDGGRIMVRSTPFGPEGMKFNPDFPTEKVYIAHTNFDIDENVFNIVDNTPGVEVLHVYSPYRMRVTIGKSFNSKRVRRIIQQRLCDVQASVKFDQETDLNIYKETLRLNQENKPWLMYILPNGQFDSKVFESEDELEKSYMEYQHVKDSIGGVIISN